MNQNKIEFNCPSCRAKLSIGGHLAGVQGPCPHCRTVIVSPNPAKGVLEPTLVAASGAKPVPPQNQTASVQQTRPPQEPEPLPTQPQASATSTQATQGQQPAPTQGQQPAPTQPVPPQPASPTSRESAPATPTWGASSAASTSAPSQKSISHEHPQGVPANPWAPKSDSEPASQSTSPHPEKAASDKPFSGKSTIDKPDADKTDWSAMMSGAVNPGTAKAPSEASASAGLEASPTSPTGDLKGSPRKLENIIDRPDSKHTGRRQKKDRRNKSSWMPLISTILLLGLIAGVCYFLWPKIKGFVDARDKGDSTATEVTQVDQGTVETDGIASRPPEETAESFPPVSAPEMPPPTLPDEATTEKNPETDSDGAAQKKDDELLEQITLPSEPENAGPSALDEPRKALNAFLAATTWESRVPFVLNEAPVRQKMASYYKENDQGPIGVQSVDFLHSDRVPETGNMLYIFNVKLAQDTGSFPVALEKTKGGYKLDWNAFIEFKDEKFKNYVSAPREESGQFHVVLTRAHYFKDDIPDIDDKICFKLNSPIQGEKATFAFVDKRSDVGRKLGESIRWSVEYFPKVELRWVKSAQNGKDFLRLGEIIQNSWRSSTKP